MALGLSKAHTGLRLNSAALQGRQTSPVGLGQPFTTLCSRCTVACHTKWGRWKGKASLLCMESRGPTRHLSPLPSPGPCFLVLSQHLGWLGDISFPPERFEIIIVLVLEDVPCFLLLQLSLRLPSTKRCLVRMGYRWVFLSSLWAAIQLPCGDWGQSHQPIQQPRPC